MTSVMSYAQQAVSVTGPDGRLKVNVEVANGKASYDIAYDGVAMLDKSPLGIEMNIGSLSDGLEMIGSEQHDVNVCYQLDRSKTSSVNHAAKELVVHLKDVDSLRMDVRFHLSDNDVAFRYELPKTGVTGSVRVMSETTGFRMPHGTTTFLCPQSNAMIGWKRTKPSYEEDYAADAPMTDKSLFGHGYTFPCLFRVNGDGWLLLSETGVDSHYCASHLSDYHDGVYTIAYPMPEENNGIGTADAAIALPGNTPWRTITVGNTLKPIVESTISLDVVEPIYTSQNTYKFGKGTWSWILWQDESINYNDQTKYVDLASAMGFQYVLVDNWWDLNIGREKIEQLVKYARTKNVEVFLWYSSSGYWNDIVQGPINCMDNSIVRKQQMKWMKRIGVKGIKVDFFGGDKQETMRLYEEILSDADDYGLMVIFHGCTLPRGWEKMYPNYVGSEAVLASENMIFSQDFCDHEAFNDCLHPFIRNSVGCMEYGGSFLNKRMNRTNAGGNIRRTTDAFSLATSVLFQNPIQNFALAPNNLTDAPKVCLDFLRDVPTTWDEVRFIDGYPGRYVVLARRKADKWFVAAISAQKEPLKLTVDLTGIVAKGDKLSVYADDTKTGGVNLTTLTVKDASKVKLSLTEGSGTVLVK